MRSLTRDSKIKAQSMPQACRQSKLPDPLPRANSEPRRIILLPDHPQGANVDAFESWGNTFARFSTAVFQVRSPNSIPSCQLRNFTTKSFSHQTLDRSYPPPHLSSPRKDLVIIYAGDCRRGLILNYCCSGRSRMQELLVLFK